MSVRRLTTAEFLEMRGEDPGIVVDVRSPQEIAGGALVDVVTADWLSGEFEQVFKQWDPGKTYYLYCRSGGRSGAAAETMAASGFAQVFNIGGYEELKAGGAE
jgi:phage shock protein E